jgi:type IV pilus secretin PilQ/predicted competence protein
MRIMWQGWGLGALIAAGLVLSSGTLAAANAPVVHVKAEVKDGAVSLQAKANGPFEYTTYRPSASLYVLDLSGVSAGDAAGEQIVPSNLLKSYRITSYSSGDKPVVRVEILMAPGVDPRLERTDAQDLTLLVSRTSSAAGSEPALSPAIAPLTANPPDVARPSEASLSIRQIHLTEDSGRTAVNISGSGALTYHAMRLHNPDRVVLDFAGARLKTSENHLASNLDPVREIRVAQFTPEVSRVVIDLRQPSAYNIAQDGDTVRVSFSPKGVSSGAVQSDSPEQPADVVTTKAAASSNPAPAMHDVTSATKPGEVPAPATVLPVALTRGSAALATPAPEPIASAAPVAASMPAAAVAEASDPAQTPAPAATAKFSGEPISVNLKDVDLRDFFRLIHEISGLNVVLDPNVKGTLTIVLDDVPWDQALDIVLKNNDLDKQLDGNVLRIATKATLQKEAEESRDLSKAQAEAADVVTTTRVLSYAKATNLSATLKKFLSSRGDIIADDRSNTLIIRDIPSTLPVLDNLIRQLDRKSQQVEIEARVVEASRSFSRDIGSQFGIAALGGHPTSVFGGSQDVGTSPIIRNFPPLPAPPIIVSTNGSSIPGSGGGATAGSIPLNTNLPATTPTSGFSYSFSAANFALDLVITAAEQKGVGKLLSKPKVITQNNEKATVKQGTKIPVQTIVNNTVSVQFVDAVLELDVTPQITSEGTVYMDVTVENDQIDQSIPRVEGIPAIDTQSAETKVTVNDGATVVIGGIIVTTQSTSIQQVPLLGSVPLLGNFFKNTTVSSTSSELLFFLTPRILPS